MTDTLISFETAKLAREKGFKELVSTYYLEGGIKREERVYIHYNIDESFYVELDEFLENFNNEFKETLDGDRCLGCDHKKYLVRYSAPTQLLLQKWLIQNYKIHAFVMPTCNYYNTFIINCNNKLVSTKRFGIYKSYEEALEQVLIQGLKLI